MTRTVITLRGAAANQAQHLVADLLAAGVDVDAEPPVAGASTDRSGGEHILEVVVALLTSATYDVAKSQVLGWVRKRNLNEADVDVSLDEAPE
ncbi:hypothetical protein [Aquipuribacter sp. MA13-6]|uniref:hypothetical protein n=1 Tax=unclassified Aquipuribacter TaxID=2635084 RepID=UPI003EEB0CC2